MLARVVFGVLSVASVSLAENPKLSDPLIPKPVRPFPGETRYLFPTDHVSLLARTRSDWLAYEKAFLARDSVGIDRMKQAGRLRAFPRGTRVKVIEVTDGEHLPCTEVRIESGPESDQTWFSPGVMLRMSPREPFVTLPIGVGENGRLINGGPEMVKDRVPIVLFNIDESADKLAILARAKQDGDEAGYRETLRSFTTGASLAVLTSVPVGTPVKLVQALDWRSVDYLGRPVPETHAPMIQVKILQGKYRGELATTLPQNLGR